MSIGFAVEVGHRVIGVVVRCDGGFGVFSSDLAYRRLEARIIPNLRKITRFATKLGART